MDGDVAAERQFRIDRAMAAAIHLESDCVTESGNARGRGGPNPFIEWLRSRRAPHANYLERLLREQVTVSAMLPDLSRGELARDRLALGLLADFAHDHGLAPGECALLLRDPEQELLDALSFLLGSALGACEFQVNTGELHDPVW